MMGILIFRERLRARTFFLYSRFILHPNQSVNDAGDIALPEKIGYVPLKNNKNGMPPPRAFTGVIP
jgi:hypothetical protein